MLFTDLRHFSQMLPEDKRSMVTADYDNLTITVQGFTIGVMVSNRQPYSLIELVDSGAPFAFHVKICFDPVPGSDCACDFHIMVEAELNLMMKMLLAPKIREALDKVVDSLVDISEGRMPKDMPSGFGL